MNIWAALSAFHSRFFLKNLQGFSPHHFSEKELRSSRAACNPTYKKFQIFGKSAEI